MATKNFKGFQLVALATFNGSDFTKDKDTLYFVRTSGDKGNGTDGFLYFNGKKYGTGADVITKYGELNGKTISAYVADEIAKVNTAAGELGKKVDANTEAIAIIKGEETVDGSIKKAVKDAKTALVGNEDTVDTIKHAEKLAKDAATAATAEKKRAEGVEAQLRTDVDAKVKSVEGTDTVVATTTEHAVSVSLKTSDKGNVQFTQDTDGLSANVTIPGATVTGVKADDKFLSLVDKLVSADVSIEYDNTDKKIYLYGKDKTKANAVSSIDCTDFIKDGMLDGSALYTATAATGTVTINTKEYKLTGLTANHAYIVLVWNTDAKKDAMAIDVTSLIDIYTAKADGGLKLEDHAFSVDTAKIATKDSVDKLNDTHAKVGGEGADKENFKTVAAEVSEGIAGIAEIGKTAGTDVKVTVTTKAGSVSAVAVDASALVGKVSANEAAITAEAQTARAAEKVNKDAIDKLNGNSGVTGSVDQKIQSALEAGAVTLEVKNDDAYLGLTSATTEGKGTVYTLASKEAKINEAIKNAADAVKVSVKAADGAYVTGSVDTAGRVVTLSEKVQAVADADAAVEGKKGLAEASDVKAYVDGKVSSMNVTATGDTYVSATVDANKVTVAATEALKTAVTKANSAVQSVNGKSGSDVELSGADIKTNQKVGENATATVNTVLADIYAKLGVAVKADGTTIKEGADHELSVNLEAKTDETVANGHVALTHGNDGALYGVMYYSGDDAE